MSLLNKFRKHTQKSSEEEIVEHISDLLNTKQTFEAYAPDLGLDSHFYASSNSQLIKSLMQDIKGCLEKFEKRVELQSIKSVPSLSRFFLSFVISCKVKSSSLSLYISFHPQKNLFNVEQKT